MSEQTLGSFLQSPERKTASRTIRYLFYHLICGRRPLCGFGSLLFSTMATGYSNKCFSFVSGLKKKKKGNLCGALCLRLRPLGRSLGSRPEEMAEEQEAVVYVECSPACDCCLRAVCLPVQRGAASLHIIRRNSANVEKRPRQRGRLSSRLCLHSWLLLPYRAA